MPTNAEEEYRQPPKIFLDAPVADPRSSILLPVFSLRSSPGFAKGGNRFEWGIRLDSYE